MTTANVTAQGVKPAGVSAAASAMDIQKRAEKAAGMFGAMMNQFGSANLQNMSIQQDSPQAAVDTSGKLEYADKISVADRGVNLTTVREQSMPERIDAAEEELEGFEESVVAAIGEELGVTEEEIQEALEVLGMTVFDLLNPQNLGMFVMQLTGMDDSTQLLMDPDFQNLMSDIGQLGNELMGQLNLGMDQMDELIRQMDVPVEPEVSVQPVEGAVDVEVSVGEIPEAAVDTVEVAELRDVPEVFEQAAPRDDTQSVGQTVATEPAEASEEEQPVIVRQAADAEGNQEDFQKDMADEPEVQMIRADGQEGGLQQQTASEQEFSREEESPRQANRQGAAAGTERVGENTSSVVNTFEMPITAQTAEIQQPVSSYASVDAIELIHQIVEQIQSAVRGDAASIEMQLNPEHLGRLYVNLTSKAGAVNAQFIATSEAVRAALETQLADLRENLNQAGVKVEAIEISVASHELEENLEQNARQEEQQAADQEENQRGRRNITLNELDELSGVLTEEEVLVAQMMKDNGNSMDVTV